MSVDTQILAMALKTASEPLKAEDIRQPLPARHRDGDRGTRAARAEAAFAGQGRAAADRGGRAQDGLHRRDQPARRQLRGGPARMKRQCPSCRLPNAKCPMGRSRRIRRPQTGNRRSSATSSNRSVRRSTIRARARRERQRGNPAGSLPERARGRPAPGRAGQDAPGRQRPGARGRATAGASSPRRPNRSGARRFSNSAWPSRGAWSWAR